MLHFPANFTKIKFPFSSSPTAKLLVCNVINLFVTHLGLVLANLNNQVLISQIIRVHSFWLLWQRCIMFILTNIQLPLLGKAHVGAGFSASSGNALVSP
jgi:hypothetical protein